MKQHVNRNSVISLLVMVMAAMSGRPVFAGEGNVSASYLYTLSNFTGVYAVSWGGVAVDEAANEIYVALGGKGIKIFNDTGMEIYSFNDEMELGNVNKVAVDDEGNIIALSWREKGFDLIRCNYRGEPVSKIELKNVPAAFAGFRSPTDIIFRNGSIYLVDEVSMMVVVTDREGTFKDGYDLASLLGLTEQKRADTGLGGFNVDREGDLLFTISAMAKAYIVSPDGTVRSFGKGGSTPGSFGVPGGIVADISGNYILVADILRCRILVFGKDLKFCTEFGYRGLSPDALIGPLGLAVDSRNRLYVTQLRDRGVSVYQIATGG